MDSGFATTDRKAKDGVKRRGEEEIVVTKRDRSIVDKGKIDNGGAVVGFVNGIEEFSVAKGLVDLGAADGPPVAGAGRSGCWAAPW